MRALVVSTTTAAVACWLLLVVPAHAEAVPDPLAELVIAGAPLVASGPSPTAIGHALGPGGPAAVSGSPSPPGAAPAFPSGGAVPGDVHLSAPAVGFPSIPNPLLGGRLVLPPLPVIRGVVLGPDGEPAEGILVWSLGYSDDGAFAGWLDYAESDGSFTVAAEGDEIRLRLHHPPCDGV